MKTTLLLLPAIALFCSCDSGASKLDHARFEIEQGNVKSARRYLEAVPQGSKARPAADSILKTLEGR